MKAVLEARSLTRRAIGAAMVVVVGGCGAAFADAPTYYVSTSGSDLNDGLTPQTAWASMLKVDTASASFAPGTQVLLERGDVWQGSLVPQSSGTVGDPITYSAYGDPNAAKPELLGSDVITGFLSLGNSAYAVATAPIPGAVYLNHDFLHQADLIAPTVNPIQYVENNADSYYYDTASSSLYVNTGGVDINSVTITATRRQNIVSSNGQSNLVFNNLQTDETAESGGGFGFLIGGGSNVTVENSDAFRAGKHHFEVINTTGFVGMNLNAEYTMPDQAAQGGASAYVAYGDLQGPAFQTSEWDNISASNLGDGGAFLTHGSGIGKVTINNLVAPGYGVGSSDDVQNGAVTINGGVMGEIRISSNGVVINGAEVVNAPIYLLGQGDTVENVLMHGLVPTDGYRAAIIVSGDNDTIRFSTVDIEAGRSDAAHVALLGAVNTTIYGNIFSGPGAYVDNVMGGGLSLYSNHNLFEFDPTYLLGFSQALTGAQWQSLFGFDLDSAIGDPMFTDRANNDFSLMPGSPAIGPFTGAFWQALSMDMFGNPRPSGTTVDMGAIETIAAPGSTIIASADTDLGAPGAAVTLNGDVLEIDGDTYNSTTRPILLGVNGGVLEVTSATNTFTLNSTVTGGAFTKGGAGRLVLAQNYNTTFVTIISQGVLELAAPSNTATEIFGSGTLQVDAGSSLVADGIAVGTLHISGSVQIRPNGTPDGNSIVNVLSLDGGKGAWSTGLDITNNHLIIEDVTNHAATLAQIKDQAQYGLTHAAGIFNSTATAGMTMAVADNALLGKILYAGTNVDAGSILVLSTYPGDADMSGTVDILDLTIVANHWLQHVSDWSQGDFDGNGTVDIQDLTAVANNWQRSVSAEGGTDGGTGSGSFSNSLGLIVPELIASSPVPEPASLFPLILGFALLRTRKRLSKP